MTLNSGANTFHSETEITPEMFDGNLSEVHISASDGDMTGCAYPDTLHDAELVQIMQPADTRTVSGLSFCARFRQTSFSWQRFRRSLISLP